MTCSISLCKCWYIKLKIHFWTKREILLSTEFKYCTLYFEIIENQTITTKVYYVTMFFNKKSQIFCNYVKFIKYSQYLFTRKCGIGYCIEINKVPFFSRPNRIKMLAECIAEIGNFLWRWIERKEREREI